MHLINIVRLIIFNNQTFPEDLTVKDPDLFLKFLACINRRLNVIRS